MSWKENEKATQKQSSETKYKALLELEKSGFEIEVAKLFCVRANTLSTWK